MSKATKFFDGFEQRIKQSIHTTAPARVVNYNADKHTADLKLLFQTNDGEYLHEYPLIEHAPVLKHVEDDIKVGSCVFVSFAERSLDNLDGNKTFDPDSRRTHSINDPVVIGVWEG
ncbi:Gp138 family membrane-puncturing spike protein [Bacillus sp. FSL M7-1004]|uniref:Gp138 family membrane-puncturing spike protein n=1 Tax=Bacillus TaxID=1386 RepID=UPI001297A9B7|nr:MULTISPECIES: Gp138 family membrane-puncturing spike protein [Bacillus]MCU9592205.1 Gp138 family membrane-puncturing spike protein [Bacillus velezensis]